LLALRPDEAWTAALAGRRVLVIHPQADLMVQRWRNETLRRLLWGGTAALDNGPTSSSSSSSNWRSRSSSCDNSNSCSNDQPTPSSPPRPELPHALPVFASLIGYVPLDALDRARPLEPDWRAPLEAMNRGIDELADNFDVALISAGGYGRESRILNLSFVDLCKCKLRN
jgi:hypothetical protein